MSIFSVTRMRKQTGKCFPVTKNTAAMQLHRTPEYFTFFRIDLQTCGGRIHGIHNFIKNCCRPRDI